MIEFKNINLVYDVNTPDETIALKDINFSIDSGEFVAIIGHTGSGKSSLVKLFNGLEIATSGEILYNQENIYQKGYDLYKLKKKIGLVFQYPENQLFELDVLADVCFGLLNYGVSQKEAVIKAKEALNLVGVDEKFYHMSPFELSGGLKRRVAIGGVLAMSPDILVLDEVTAALDAKGKEKILNLLKKLNTEKGRTIILVSHSMEDVAEYSQRILVMNQGTIRYNDTPKNIFKKISGLESIGLSVPKANHIVRQLKQRGLKVDVTAITIDEAKNTIMQAVGDFRG